MYFFCLEPLDSMICTLTFSPTLSNSLYSSDSFAISIYTSSLAPMLILHHSTSIELTVPSYDLFSRTSITLLRSLKSWSYSFAASLAYGSVQYNFIPLFAFVLLRLADGQSASCAAQSKSGSGVL